MCVCKEMVNLGVDIKYEDKGSLYRGNALNVAHSKEQAEWLLKNGVEIERNLSVQSFVIFVFIIYAVTTIESINN